MLSINIPAMKKIRLTISRNTTGDFMCVVTHSTSCVDTPENAIALHAMLAVVMMNRIIPVSLMVKVSMSFTFPLTRSGFLFC